MIDEMLIKKIMLNLGIFALGIWIASGYALPISSHDDGKLAATHVPLPIQLVNGGEVMLDLERRSVTYVVGTECFQMSWEDALTAARQYDPKTPLSVTAFEKLLPLYKELFRSSHLELEPTLELGLIIVRYCLDTARNPSLADDYMQSEALSLAYEFLFDEDKNSPLLALVGFLSGRIELEMKRYQQAYAFFINAHNSFGDYSDQTTYKHIDPDPEKCSQHYQQALCLCHAARSLAELGWLDQADQLLDRSWEDLKCHPGNNRPAKLMVLYEKAELALKARQPTKVIDFMRQTLTEKVY